VLLDIDLVSRAEQTYRRNLALHHRLHDRRDEGEVLRALGQVALQRGQLDTAEHCFEQALAIDSRRC
jgi:tetratricopeptide (TPR) repeat protein